MRPRSIALLLLAALAALTPVGSRAASPHSLPGFDYVSPAPGTTRHRPQTNVIVRPGGTVVPSSLDRDGLIVAVGSGSGAHSGRTRLSDDGRTILFRPDQPFLLGETVTCTIAPGIRTDREGTLPGGSFTFRLMDPFTPAPAASWPGDPGYAAEAARFAATSSPPPEALAPDDAAPDDYPRMTTAVRGETGRGYLFLADVVLPDPTWRSTLMIVRNDGSAIFRRKLAARAFDFKTQPDGRLTYYDAARNFYVALDPAFVEVDSFRCANGYLTDLHDLRLLPGGHALLLSYDTQIVDMSAVVPGGRTRATVTGLVVQELDREKEVVFQWRSWDHFAVTDATGIDFTGPGIDYVHGNSVERDQDGHLLISCRHMDEVTKIDRDTGEVLWRLGGTHNEFAFPNDPVPFSHQHAARRLPNGHLLLFDNGNLRVPFYSRVVEYALDESRRIATLVWEHRDVPDAGSFAMGYAQRLENGNTLIAWGAFPRTVTEVTPEGWSVFDGSLPAPLYSYRVYRQEWPPIVPSRVAVEPAVFGASSRGRWVMASIASDGFDAAAVDPAAITIAGDVPADPGWAARAIGPDGTTALRVRFDRGALLARLRPGANRVEVEGPLPSGARFREAVELRVTGAPARGRDGRAVRVVSAPGALPAKISLDAAAGPTRVAVYDVRGRLVRAWSAVPDEEGLVAWDGRGAGGRPAAAGIYFVRAAGAGGGAAARVVIAR